MRRIESVNNHLKTLMKDKKFSIAFEKEKRRLTQDEILRLLKRLWKKYPELRLGQLLSNAIQITDIYYVPDDALLKCLMEYKP